MLKRILQLSACLMMTLNLSSAQAEIRDSDVAIRSCTNLPLKDRPNCCEPDLSACAEKVKPYIDSRFNPKTYCCIKCMWNFGYRPDQFGEEREAMRACAGQE